MKEKIILFLFGFIPTMLLFSAIFIQPVLGTWEHDHFDNRSIAQKIGLID